MIYHNSNEHKQQVYKRWLDNGRPWFHIDKTKEPTYDEKQIIMEMKKQEEKPKSKRDIELEKSAAVSKPVNEIKAFHRLVNNALDNY